LALEVKSFSGKIFEKIFFNFFQKLDDKLHKMAEIPFNRSTVQKLWKF